MYKCSVYIYITTHTHILFIHPSLRLKMRQNGVKIVEFVLTEYRILPRFLSLTFHTLMRPSLVTEYKMNHKANAISKSKSKSKSKSMQSLEWNVNT